MKYKKTNLVCLFLLFILSCLCIYFYYCSVDTPYVCPGYVTIVKPGPPPPGFVSPVNSVQVPYVCNQLIIDNQHLNYNIWRDRLIDFGYTKIDSCQCSSGIELWESPIDVNPIGVVEDPPPDAGAIGGDGRPIYNFLLDLPIIDSLVNPVIPPEEPPGPLCDTMATVKIAVVDSGVDTTRNPTENYLLFRDWRKAGIPNRCDAVPASIEFGINKIRILTEPIDNNGHGTHVQGIIAGLTENDGTKRFVPFKYLNVKFINDKTGSLYHAICGMYFALEQDVHIINISWGYLDDIYDGESLGPPLIFERVLEEAQNDSVLIVAGVGNDATDLSNRYKFWPSGFADKHPNLIAVGAINKDNDDRASFSNWALDGNMTLATTGVDVQSAFPRYLQPGTSNKGIASISGTSMATPFVVRTAAVIKGIKPSLTPQQIKNCIITSSTTKNGYLILNHEAAVNLVCGNNKLY